MFFQTADASFKMSWKLEKAVHALTEVYLNEDLFYKDGYKLTVTNEANQIIKTKASSFAKNYIDIQLLGMDDLSEGELI